MVRVLVGFFRRPANVVSDFHTLRVGVGIFIALNVVPAPPVLLTGVRLDAFLDVVLVDRHRPASGVCDVRLEESELRSLVIFLMSLNFWATAFGISASSP